MTHSLCYLVLFFIMICLNSCNEVSSNDSTELGYQSEHPPITQVGIMTLKQDNFDKEILSNGILRAKQKAGIRFHVNGKIARLYFQNGDWVNKGQVIGSLEDEEYLFDVKSKKIALEKAELEYSSLMLMQAQYAQDTSSVSDHLRKAMLIKSGLPAARHDLEKAKFYYAKTKLVAPFSGKLANLKKEEFEYVTSAEEFCTLLNDRSLTLEFQLTEFELLKIAIGQDVEVTVFDQPFQAKVTEINPLLDQHGLAEVKAEFKNDALGFFDGMNASVKLLNRVPKQLVVPKSAVISRQEQELVFKYKNGVAWWTYVEILAENGKTYAIQADPYKGGRLSDGDTVIVSGNLSLAHESRVHIESDMN